MKKDLIKFVVLLAVALGSAPAYSAYWNWSKTAATNATADASINWSEGMSPSSVNDSARAMMARSAEQRDDVSGLLATGGTSTAYTVATNQGLNTPTPTDGQMIAVTMNATNGVSPTLAADGGTAFAIQTSPGVAVAAGTLVSGTPYTLKFSTANSAWMVRGFFGSALTVPLGALIPHTLTTVPNSNFIFPAGQCISTTTYSAYWVALGSPASGGCPGGQFAVIDLRGRALVAIDNLGGSAANRLTSSATGCGTTMNTIGAVCANGNESQTITVAQMPVHTHGVTDTGHTHSVSGGTVGGTSVTQFTGATPASGPSNSSGITIVSNTTGISIQNEGGNGAHPVVNPNIGVSYILRVL